MAARKLNNDCAVSGQSDLSAMLGRARELATNGAAEAADNKTGTSQNANSNIFDNVAITKFCRSYMTGKATAQMQSEAAMYECQY